MDISIVIVTYRRPAELYKAINSIIQQTALPKEIIIVDNSNGQDKATNELCTSFSREFQKLGIPLRYLPSKENSLTSGRNLGVAHSSGEIIFFNDDDAILDQRCLKEILKFYKDHSEAMGVEGLIVRDNKEFSSLFNAVYKVFFLSHLRNENIRKILPMGRISPFPSKKTIECMLLGGISSYRSLVFKELKFDQKLKRFASCEDADFSYRLYRLHPGTLFHTPRAIIFHKHSSVARLPTKLEIYMSTTYRLYFFYKNFELSASNLLKLVWGMFGKIICEISGLIFKKKSRKEWWRIVYLISSYIYVIRHQNSIKMMDLEFFDEILDKKV
jgi:GT2 family glycosyltransferase